MLTTPFPRPRDPNLRPPQSPPIPQPLLWKEQAGFRELITMATRIGWVKSHSVTAALTLHCVSFTQDTL